MDNNSVSCIEEVDTLLSKIEESMVDAMIMEDAATVEAIVEGKEEKRAAVSKRQIKLPAKFQDSDFVVYGLRRRGNER